jgi:hypothetical protein
MKNLLKGVITAGTGGIGFIAGEFAGAGIDAVRGILQEATSFKTDTISHLRNSIDELFQVGGYRWKQKYASLKAEWEKKQRELDKKRREMEGTAKGWLASKEYAEYRKWKKEHPKATINEDTKKFNELKKKYEDRIKKEREEYAGQGSITGGL